VRCYAQEAHASKCRGGGDGAVTNSTNLKNQINRKRMQASAEEEGIEPNGAQDKANGNADFVGTALEHLNLDSAVCTCWRVFARVSIC
jgi:hypothetical protein